jgi:hypothetical protein
MPKITGIAVAPNQNERLELVAVSVCDGSPDVVWHASQINPRGEWAGWEPLGEPGGASCKEPAVALDRDGHLQAVVVARGPRRDARLPEGARPHPERATGRCPALRCRHPDSVPSTAPNSSGAAPT